MIGRLVRAIRPGSDPHHPGTDEREAPRSDGRDGADGPAELGELDRGKESSIEGDGKPLGAEAFLDPDERVLVLLSECDGRMWQLDVVERTGYSAARVSELLCEMEAAGRINRYWKDGEKVVSFPEIDPD